VDLSIPPPGFGQSCAASRYSWTDTLSRSTPPFVCIDEATVIASSRSVMVRGWASGAFESNVQVRMRDAADADLVATFTNVTGLGAGYDGPPPRFSPSELGHFSKTFDVPASVAAGATRVLVFLPDGRGDVPPKFTATANVTIP
ncbi:MAG: hypothetical protein WCG92_25550, partial [Hyphomicrobiales bacterium]